MLLWVSGCATQGARLLGDASPVSDAVALSRALAREVSAPGRTGVPVDDRIVHQVQATYQRSGHRPQWLREGVPDARADEALAVLAASTADGLRASDYGLDALRADAEALRAGRADAEVAARFDLGLSLALARRLCDTRAGRIPPADAGVRLEVSESLAAVPGLISRALEGGESPTRVALAAQPSAPLYPALRRALADYRQRLARAGDTQMPPLPAGGLKPGQSWAGVPALTRRLALLGDYAGAPLRGDHYSGGAVEAVRAFQERHGLTVDGVIGPTTWRALATPLSWRVRQIELAMERVRWLGSPVRGRPYVVINIPQYRLWAFPGNGQPAALTMAVMVGEPSDSQTPVMHEALTHIVFSPYWNVPPGILREELLPQLRRDPAWLAREHMEVVSGQTPLAGVPDRATLDALASGRYRLRQRPGPWNALGTVKFQFPNAHAIYLHDTSSRHLFSRSRRDVSHGCIRVRDPQGLAAFLLADQPGWSRDAIAKAMTAGRERHVRLGHPVPVLIFYNTTMVALDGRVAFLEDVYGLDRRLDRALTDRSASSRLY